MNVRNLYLLFGLYQFSDIQIQAHEGAYFIVPPIYQQNLHFLGRDDILEQLRQMLCVSRPETYNHRVALYGMGGVGKTQCAMEYMFRYKPEYCSVFWISAATQADFQTGFQKIAERTNCIADDEKDADAVARAVLYWLSKQSSWLLVIDNLDDISVVERYLPDTGSADDGHILITTRNQDPTGIPAQGLEVKIFDSRRAIDLLLLRATGTTQQSQPEMRSHASKIVDQLGYLPLAIEHAAAYIRQSSPDLSKFLDMYSQSRKEFLEDLPNQNYAYPRAVAATLLMSFETVSAENEEAAKLLVLFSFLNPDGILVEFLQAGYEGLDDPLRSLINNPFKFRKALGKLGQFSLVRQSRDGQTIAVHRLVQAVIRDHLETASKVRYEEATISLFLSAFPDFEKDKRQICRRYQAQVLGPLLAVIELGTEDVANVLLRVGYFLSRDGKYYNGEQFEHKAVEMCTVLFGPEDNRTLLSMNNLASTYRALGRTKAAASLHQKALEARTRTLGKEHTDTLMSMNNLAVAYRALGRTKEAAGLQQKALESRTRTLGKEHPDTLGSMNNLAETYRALGRTKEATGLHQKALEAQTRTLGEEHPDTLWSMNLEETYRALVRTQEAAGEPRKRSE